MLRHMNAVVARDGGEKREAVEPFAVDGNRPKRGRHRLGLRCDVSPE